MLLESIGYKHWLLWHGRGHRFDPGQVHQSSQAFSATSFPTLCRILVANSKTFPAEDRGPLRSEASFGSGAVAVFVPTIPGLSFRFAGFDRFVVDPADAAPRMPLT